MYKKNVETGITEVTFDLFISDIKGETMTTTSDVVTL